MTHLGEVRENKKQKVATGCFLTNSINKTLLASFQSPREPGTDQSYRVADILPT